MEESNALTLNWVNTREKYSLQQSVTSLFIYCKIFDKKLLISHSILICSIFHLNWRVAHLIQFYVTCKFGLTMQLICHSILICSIFHLN